MSARKGRVVSCPLSLIWGTGRSEVKPQNMSDNIIQQQKQVTQATSSSQMEKDQPGKPDLGVW
jgi:hypothetical protein